MTYQETIECAERFGFVSYEPEIFMPPYPVTMDEYGMMEWEYAKTQAQEKMDEAYLQNVVEAEVYLCDLVLNKLVN